MGLDLYASAVVSKDSIHSKINVGCVRKRFGGIGGYPGLFFSCFQLLEAE